MRGRGRPTVQICRPLIAIGIKLTIIHGQASFSLGSACEEVNAVCSDEHCDAGMAGEEPALNDSTLRKKVRKYMDNVTWRDLRREKHLHLWQHAMKSVCPKHALTILRLVQEACIRMETRRSAPQHLNHECAESPVPDPIWSPTLVDHWVVFEEDMSLSELPPLSDGFESIDDEDIERVIQQYFI